MLSTTFSLFPIEAEYCTPALLAGEYGAIIFMKVGSHGREEFDRIIERKSVEELTCGTIFWGYGGSACNPLTQVVPFAEKMRAMNVRPTLMMSFTPSRFEGSTEAAKEFSSDGNRWQPLPRGARVKGSRYAITCRALTRVDLEVNLAEYRVAVGPKVGTPLSDYVRYRTDKACAVRGLSDGAYKPVRISYTAEMTEPYAVLLR